MDDALSWSAFRAGTLSQRRVTRRDRAYFMSIGILIQALGFALLPVGVLIITGVVALWRTPGARLRSALQHFAAGVVFEAAAVEVLPEIRQAHSAVPIILGFALGTTLVLLVGQLTKGTEQNESGETSSPVGLLTTVGIDVFIDGLLIGIGFVSGAKVGMLLTLALTMEFLFVGLTTASTLATMKFSRLRVLLASTGLALLVLVGATLGAAVLAVMPRMIQVGVLSFGVAALLYLVTEELLVEAHEVQETTFAAAMFFVGFLLFLILGLFG